MVKFLKMSKKNLELCHMTSYQPKYKDIAGNEGPLRCEANHFQSF